MDKKKILICIDWFEPAYKAGGPIRSVKNLVSLLKDELDFYLLTSDRDLGDDEAFGGVELDKWLKKENYSIYYLSQKNKSQKKIRYLLKERDYHKYYFNSVFSIWFTLLPLFLLKKSGLDHRAVLAPRGMLGKGALQIKAFKKKLFLGLIRLSNLFVAIKWHASTELEEAEIKKHFGKAAKVQIAKNVAFKPLLNHALINLDVDQKVNFIFLSRISRKKNLLDAISFFEGLHFSGKEVYFNIFGPIEDQEYWQTCQKAIQKLNTSVKIQYKGVLNREEIYSKLMQHHFFLFPTYNENFGHNISEALLVGLPVIISDQTPWLDLKKQQAGWDISLENKSEFVKVIQQAINMGRKEYTEWSKSARLYAEKTFFSDEIYQSNKELFLDEQRS